MCELWKYICPCFEGNRYSLQLSLDSEDFFQQMLNRIVQIVYWGLIRPHDGARLLHGCASILDMQLLREIPKTIVAIRGLRKTNDLAQGHDFLVKSLNTYGEIIDASISPKNKGFGKFPVNDTLYHCALKTCKSN